MAKVIGKSSGYLENRTTESDLNLFLVMTFLGALSVVLSEIERLRQHIPIHIYLGIFAAAFLLLIFLKVVVDREMIRGEKWLSGHRGENIAQKALANLPESYTVFRDVRLGGKGNIDFVVVGPNGVFVVEVKNHAGAIGFDGSVLTRNGRPIQERNLLLQAINQSFQLRDYLTKRVGYQMFVTPILVFTHTYAKVRFGLTPIKGVTVVRKESLQQAIVAVKGSLGADLTASVAGAMKETVTS